MGKIFLYLSVLFSVSACNTIYVRPNSLDKNEIIYADAGGDLMRLKTKEIMEDMGYKLTIGHHKATISTTYITAEGTESVLAATDLSKARYIVFMKESNPKFRPIWCSLNGFWWSKFNLSISDNETGQELLHWTGRGCVNSSVRKLKKILNQMEIK